MILRIYNSLTRQIEEFEPISPPRVTMYVCGITAYDSSHLGHARSAIIFDVLYRILLNLRYQVIYVRNITDIDDKIIHRAQREGKSWKEITETYIREYREELEELKVLKPTYEPRASEHIQEMIEIIQNLIDKGFAYESGGDVYFAVEKFPLYGKLSGRKLEEMLAGVRIDPSEKKRHPLDFALWKSAKPGEPYWDSPWGPGRPGWHIECSAMSLKYLGETIDVHGGGLDLIFPHHENEIAQSEAFTGKPFVKYFIHHGLITVNGEKMSKSLGNFVTTRFLLERYHPEVIRAFLLSKHYRSPLDYSEKSIHETERALYKLYETLYWIGKTNAVKEGGLRDDAQKLERALSEFKDRFVNSLLEDLNTAQALGYLFGFEGELYNFINRHRDLTESEKELLRRVVDSITELSSKFLGLLEEEPEEFFQRERERKLRRQNLSVEEVQELIDRRYRARLEKNFSLADEIRDKLQSLGVRIKDTREGTFWYVE